MKPAAPNPDDMLVSFALGELSGPQEDRLRAILAGDPSLADRAARMRQIVDVMRGDDSEPATGEAIRRALLTWSRRGSETAVKWVARARRFIAELAYDSRLRAAPLGFRGAGARGWRGGYQLGYACPAGRVDIHVAPRGSGWRVRGQVAPRGPAIVGPVALMPPGGGETIETQPDEHGRFRLEPQAGVYDLLIELDHGQRAILAHDLEIGQG